METYAPKKVMRISACGAVWQDAQHTTGLEHLPAAAGKEESPTEAGRVHRLNGERLLRLSCLVSMKPNVTP